MASKTAAPDHMRLWDALKRTDPKATKPFTRSGGFKGTQIDPTWRIQRMTEMFGPIGQGWGWEQLEWTIHENIVFICAKVWYRDPGKDEIFETGPQWGGTEILLKNRDGSQRPNDEAFKMSLTDAVGKCLVQLGLAADVHLGLFDDSKYRMENERYFAGQQVDKAPEEVAKYRDEVVARIRQIETKEALDAYWREQGKRINALDAAVKNYLVAQFKQRAAQFAQSEQVAEKAPQQAAE